MIAIDAKQVSRRFRGAVALDRIDLCLEEGCVHGVAGLPGSGRSTLLRLLAGLDRSSSGQVEVFGGNPQSAAIRGRIGVAPLPHLLDPRRTVRETLADLARLRGLPHRSVPGTVGRLLGEAQLESFGPQAVSELPSSVRQRVAICAAWIGDPELVVLDLPDANLPAGERDVLRALVGAQAARGKTTLLAGAGRTLLGELSDNLILLHHGTLLASATPTEIRSGLRGLLFKFAVREPESLPPSSPGFDVRRSEEGLTILTDRDASDELAGQYGVDAVTEVAPTFEETCTWILLHPDQVATRSRLWSEASERRSEATD